MGLKRVTAAAMLAVGLSGCSFIERELDNRGGYIDTVLDARIMKADSKDMRILRGYAVQAALLRLAGVSPKKATERQIIAERMLIATDRLNNLLGCTLVPRGQPPCFHFDSLMVDYENALYELAIAVFDTEERRSLIGRVANLLTGPAAVVNVLDLILDLILDVGREAFNTGRLAGALYRDATELEVQVWLDSVADRPLERRARDGAPFSAEAIAKVAALRALYDSDRDDLPAWRRVLAELNALEVPAVLPRHYAAVYRIVHQYCQELVNPGPAQLTCRKPPYLLRYFSRGLRRDYPELHQAFQI